MLFNSLHFLIFFPIVVIVYFSLPHKWRWMLLLAASYYFYMCWKVEYLLLIITSTLIDYSAGIMMGKTGRRSRRRKYLILSLCSNLGLLFAFKYFNFFNGSLDLLFRKFNLFYGIPAFNVLLPVGISFYTFQTLSYTIDVYRGHTKPEKHLGIFALYVAFFPQLVAGPIERSTRLLPQFLEKHDFDPALAASGLRQMMWGFFKKVVIADRLAMVVNHVYNNPADSQGIHFLVATVFFAFQIYCDFSGYSDIAIGAARVMGFDLMKNFNRPYYAKSISEFWKRWHISLSSWFRDYLYIPLGGNRVAVSRWYLNIFLVFLISGLWHGANWTFMAWGLLHGCYLICAVSTVNMRSSLVRAVRLDRLPALHRFMQVGTTFALVCFAWIFFRANSMSDALYIITHLFTGVGDFIHSVVSLDLSRLRTFNVELGIPVVEFGIALASIAFMEAIHFIQRRGNITHSFFAMPVPVRWAAYYSVIFAILFFGKFDTNEFIYFQF
ncbi:MAG: MBOAT family O-acyltransferase [Planctomycetota bacterium]|jgi:D-alanyl-lipoteichoic acid acyltransferase DltB (MBOAT superfamily)